MLVTKTVKIAGIGEKEVEDRIRDLIKKNSNPSIYIYPKSGEVHIHVTAKGADMNECDRLNKPVIKELKTLAPDTPVTILIGPEGDFSIEEVRLAMEQGYESVSLGASRLRTETAALSAVMMAQLATN